MRRIARIWGAVIVACALLMLVGSGWNLVTTGTADPHAVKDYPAIENLPVFFSLLGIVGLGVAWRWEGLGGATAVLFNLAALPVLLIHWPIAERFPRYLLAPYGVWMLIVIPGILFLMCWWRSRKRATP